MSASVWLNLWGNSFADLFIMEWEKDGGDVLEVFEGIGLGELRQLYCWSLTGQTESHSVSSMLRKHAKESV